MIVLLIIAPGAVTHLRPDKDSLVRLASVAVCDCRSPKNRLICSNLEFHVFDRYNNMCDFPVDHSVICTLRRVSAEDSGSETSMDVEILLPLLEGADEGRLCGAFDTDVRVCSFAEISIEHSAGQRAIRDGEYQLHFELADPSGESSRFLVPVTWTALVNYTSDEQRQSRIETTKSDQKPLLERKYRHAELVEEVRGIAGEIARIQRENPSMPALKDYSRDTDDLVHQIERRRQQLSDMQTRVSQTRPVKKTDGYPSPLLTAGLETVGLVVDKLFVDDENEAFILSWAAIGLINALIVPTTSIAKTIYKKKDNNIKVWSLDQMQRFRIRGQDNLPR